MIFVNKPDAFVIQRSRALNVPVVIFNRHDFYHSPKVLELLSDNQIDYIILAGFLWLVPESIIKAFPNHIINIHPGLLPKYGGKGMYGMKVHEAVINNQEIQSGITIHFVNEAFDEGEIIFQATCPVLPGDSPEQLADRIHKLEYKYYPEIIRQVLAGTKK
jgi:phosphoribosylglycinamide formyltransferase-1